MHRSYEPITRDDYVRSARSRGLTRLASSAGGPNIGTGFSARRCAREQRCTTPTSSQHIQSPTGSKTSTWSFFAEIPGERFPANRRMTHVDLGPSKFGRSDHSGTGHRHFTGRRVDLLMRALPVPIDADAVAALRSYLTEARTVSADRLARKAVVMIDPPAVRGQMVWSPERTVRAS